MDEVKLQRLVERFVREEIQLLIEYSFNRKEFVNKIESLLTPLLSHWVLIRYNRLTSNEEYIQHWKRELKGWFVTLMRLRLKDNNSVKNREKAIQSAYENLDLTSDLKALYLTVLSKCEKENIDTTDKPFEQAIIDCANELNTIKQIIANADAKYCDEYVKSL